VLLGGTAGKALYGSGFRVGEARGRLLDWPEGLVGDAAAPAGEPGQQEPPWVLTTTHPSAVLRSRERDRDYDLFVEDLHVAAEALSAPARPRAAGGSVR
jgi:hypothetical protein